MSRSSTRSDERWDWGSKPFDLTTPPPGSGITVAPLADGVRLVVRLHAPWYNWPILCFGFLVCAAGALFAFENRRGLPPLQARPCYAALPHVVIGVLLILAGVNAWYRHLVLVVRADELHLALVSLVYAQRRHWQRDELRWIAAWEGLRIIAPPRSLVMKLRDDADRCDWLAEYLRAALQLPRQLDALPDEIEVYFTTEPARPPDRGFLLARQGRFAFRYDFVGIYVYELVRHDHPEGFHFPPILEGRQYRIDHEDVRCKVDDDDLVQLEIQCGSGRREFWLTAWCADKDALEAALARFRGAREEESPSDRSPAP
jgi:hypothetical protein